MSKNKNSEKTTSFGPINFSETLEYKAVIEEIHTAQIALHGAANLVRILEAGPTENLTALAIATDIASILQNRIEHASERLLKAETLSELKSIIPNLKFYVNDAFKRLQDLSENYVFDGSASKKIGPTHITETEEYRQTRHKIDGMGDFLKVSSDLYESGITDMTSRNYNFAVGELNTLIKDAEEDIAAANSYSQLQGIRNRLDSGRSTILRAYTPPTTNLAPALPEVAYGNFNNVEIAAITTGAITGFGLFLLILNRNRIKTFYNSCYKSCTSLVQSGLSFFQKTPAVIHATEENTVVREAKASRRIS